MPDDARIIPSGASGHEQATGEGAVMAGDVPAVTEPEPVAAPMADGRRQTAGGHPASASDRLGARDARLSRLCGQSWPEGALLDALNLSPALDVPGVDPTPGPGARRVLRPGGQVWGGSARSGAPAGHLGGTGPASVTWEGAAGTRVDPHLPAHADRRRRPVPARHVRVRERGGSFPPPLPHSGRRAAAGVAGLTRLTRVAWRRCGPEHRGLRGCSCRPGFLFRRRSGAGSGA